MPKAREIRDPVHGFVHPTETERKVIDSAVFQRLRRIRQLAMAHLVYPGALHTRFDHSIGVMHVAGKIARHLNFKKEREQVVRLAALLHDLGHGPFSHVSEPLLAHFTGLPKTEELHEAVTVAILTHDAEIRQVLGHYLDPVVRLIRGPGKGERSSVDRDIISGPLDADKLDYLLRDSYFAGVKYGVYDIDRLINSFINLEGEQLGLEYENRNAVEQFLVAKHFLNMQVYRHKVRLVADAMTVKGAKVAAGEGLLELGQLYNFDDSPAFVRRYLNFDDEALMRLLLESETVIGRDYFERLRSRRLFKVLGRKDISEIEDFYVKHDVAQELLNEDCERAVAEVLGVDGRLIIAQPEIFRLPGHRKDIDKIFVRKGGATKTLSEVSELFQDMHGQSRGVIRFLVYGPVNKKQESIRGKLEDEIKETLDLVFKNPRPRQRNEKGE